MSNQVVNNLLKRSIKRKREEQRQDNSMVAEIVVADLINCNKNQPKKLKTNQAEMYHLIKVY